MRFTQYNNKPTTRGVKQIGDLMGRFVKIAQDGDMARSAVVEALAEAGIRITTDKLSIRGTTVLVTISPAGKNEIFLKQGRIIESLRRNPLTEKITAVR